MPVTLKAGETFVVNDPPFQDVTAALQSLQVTPASATVAKGTSQQFNARATFAEGGQRGLSSSVAWNSTDTAIATVSATGQASGVAPGQTTITATLAGISSQANLTVSPATIVSIAVSPTNQTIASGATQQFTATATLSDGTTQPVTDTASWDSDNEDVATIDDTGLATAKASGSTTITATQGEFSGQTFLLVEPAPVSAGPFLYVANTNAHTVTGFSIDRDSGALTPVPGSPFHSEQQSAYSLAVDPSGRYLYLANRGSATVSGFAIDPTNGALEDTELSPYGSDGTNPYFITIDPTGRFVYVANQSSNDISLFALNAINGALTSVIPSPFRVGPNSPYDGTFPSSLAIHPTGRFAYSTNYTSHNLTVFEINQTSGGLTQVGGLVSCNNPFAIVIDPTGRFAYVANIGNSQIHGFKINPSDGTLSPLTQEYIGTNDVGPRALVVDKTGRFVYVANSSGDNTIAVLEIDQGNGNLTHISGSPFDSGGIQPYSLTTDPNGCFLYVAHFGTGEATIFKLNQSSGALEDSGLDPVNIGENPRSIVTTP